MDSQTTCGWRLDKLFQTSDNGQAMSGCGETADNGQIYLYFVCSLSVVYLHFIYIYPQFIRAYILQEHRCHAVQKGNGNFQKTFYKTFPASCRPRLYINSLGESERSGAEGVCSGQAQALTYFGCFSAKWSFSCDKPQINTRGGWRFAWALLLEVTLNSSSFLGT